MNEKKYNNLVDKLSPKENKTKNALAAFFVGGLIGLLGELIINILMCSFGLSRVDSYAYLAMIIIFFII